jgi:hypothetical protein
VRREQVVAGRSGDPDEEGRGRRRTGHRPRTECSERQDVFHLVVIVFGVCGLV